MPDENEKNVVSIIAILEFNQSRLVATDQIARSFRSEVKANLMNNELGR